MALIDTLLGKLVRKGTLTVVMPDGRARNFGPGGGPELTVHLADRRTAFAIARNPRLGFGEAYMDGRIRIEGGDILDLMRLVVGANRWEDKGARAQGAQQGQEEMAGAVPPQRGGQIAQECRAPLRHRQRPLPPLPRRRHAI